MTISGERYSQAATGPQPATPAAQAIDDLYRAHATTLAAYSATTGQQTRVLRSWPPSAALSCALTMDPAGRYLLLALGDTPDGKLVRPVPGQPKRGDVVTTKLIAVSLTSGGFSPLPTQLPGPAAEGGLAW
jgi:hypothetical protein